MLLSYIISNACTSSILSTVINYLSLVVSCRKILMNFGTLFFNNQLLRTFSVGILTRQFRTATFHDELCAFVIAYLSLLNSL